MSAGLETSTVTPGSTAPDESLTTPVIDACAKTADGRSMSRPTTTNAARSVRIESSLVNARGSTQNRPGSARILYGWGGNGTGKNLSNSMNCAIVSGRGALVRTLRARRRGLAPPPRRKRGQAAAAGAARAEGAARPPRPVVELRGDDRRSVEGHLRLPPHC